MDKFSKRFLWLASQMLRDCKLNDPAEQAEVRQIVQRLQELAGSTPDEKPAEGGRLEIQDR